ncbi:MAG TPA: hypothetical protein VK666_27725 [Chryseolinea sp.]|nr:hypothetical protein [Chryseolinea sp.]
MEYLKLGFLYFGIITTAMMLFGLYKPWLMLWWKDVQTRRGVLAHYGTVATISYFVYWILILNTR